MQDRKFFSKDSLLGFAKDIESGAKKAASSLSTTIKEGASQFDEMMTKRKHESDLKKYAPIWEDTITDPEFVWPDVIRVVGEDIRRSVEACEGAVGFYTEGKDCKILNIYREYTHLFSGIKWYPLEEEAVYHADPCHKKLYIRLDEYFPYLKKVRVDELISVAHDLGAKYVEITLKVSEASSSSEQRDRSIRFKGVGAQTQHEKSSSATTGLEVAAQVEFKGGSLPTKPKTVYFKNEHDIQTLIKMRLSSDRGNDILSKKYSFRYANSSGIKVSDAQKIDAALSSLKIGASQAFLGEAFAENNTLLEYRIDF